METKPYPLRLKPDMQERIKLFAKKKSIPFATACRVLIVERLTELEEIASPAQSETKPICGENSTPILVSKECVFNE